MKRTNLSVPMANVKRDIRAKRADPQIIGGEILCPKIQWNTSMEWRTRL